MYNCFKFNVINTFDLILFQFQAYCLSWASKKIIQSRFAFLPLYCDFSRLIILTFKYH